MSFLDKKPEILARLKNNESPEAIAADTGLSVALIEDWLDEFDLGDKTEQQANAIALVKATDLLLNSKDTDLVTLELQLIKVADAIARRLPAALGDYEAAKTLSIAADALAKIHKSYFENNPKVAIINQNNLQDKSDSEVSTFQEVLRD